MQVTFYPAADDVARYASLFAESDHPRDEHHQKFVEKSGSHSAATGPKKPSKKTASNQDQLFATSEQGTLFGKQAKRVGELAARPPELPKKTPSRISVGETVTWNSKTGPVDAEYRGKMLGMDGYEATIIVRNPGEPPYQITVPMGQVEQKTESPADAFTVKQASPLPGQKGMTEMFEAAFQGQEKTTVQQLKGNDRAGKGEAAKVHIDDLEFSEPLSEEVSRLDDNSDMPIIIEETDTGYKLIDGFGRASGMKNAGRETIHAIIVTKGDIAERRGAGDDAEWVAKMHSRYAPKSKMNGDETAQYDTSWWERYREIAQYAVGTRLPAPRFRTGMSRFGRSGLGGIGGTGTPDTDKKIAAVQGLVRSAPVSQLAQAFQGLIGAFMGKPGKPPARTPVKTPTNTGGRQTPASGAAQRGQPAGAGAPGAGAGPRPQTPAQQAIAAANVAKAQANAQAAQARAQAAQHGAHAAKARAQMAHAKANTPAAPAKAGPAGAMAQAQAPNLNNVMSPALQKDTEDALKAFGHKPKEIADFMGKLAASGEKFNDLQDVLKHAYKPPPKAVNATVPEGQIKPHERPTTGSGKDRWIQIGAKNHHGGTPVKIDGEGKIEAGPAGLEGKNVDELPARKPLPGWKKGDQTQTTGTEAKAQPAASVPKPAAPNAGVSLPQATEEPSHAAKTNTNTRNQPEAGKTTHHVTAANPDHAGTSAQLGNVAEHPELAKARAEVEAARQEAAAAHKARDSVLSEHARYIAHAEEMTRKHAELKGQLQNYEAHHKAYVDDLKAKNKGLDEKLTAAEQKYARMFDNPRERRKAEGGAKRNETVGSQKQRLTLLEAAHAHKVDPDELGAAVDAQIAQDEEHWQRLKEVVGKNNNLSPPERKKLQEGDEASLKGRGDYEEMQERAEQAGMDWQTVWDAVTNGMPPKPSAADEDYVAKVASQLEPRGHGTGGGGGRAAGAGEADESDLPAPHQEDDNVPFSLRDRGGLVAVYARQFDDLIAQYAAGFDSAKHPRDKKGQFTFHVHINKAYFPKEIHPKDAGVASEFFEEFRGVKASTRTNAAAKIWAEHGDRLLKLMGPQATKLPRIVSLHVSSPDYKPGSGSPGGSGPGRLQPIRVHPPEQAETAQYARAKGKPAAGQKMMTWHEFKESEHPRGQPENAGEFAEVAGGSANKTDEPAKSKGELAPEEDYKQNGTKAKAFKSWFGDWESDPAGSSKVVNAETGEPQETYGTQAKRVFHGTTAKFDAFDKSKIGQSGIQAGEGFYFCENSKVAETFGRTIEAFINIRNPFNFEADFSKEQMDKLMESVSILGDRPFNINKAQLMSDARFSDARQRGSKTISGLSAWYILQTVVGEKEVNKLIANAGYDGITHVASDSYGTVKRNKNERDFGRVWIAFEPNQIKAVDNQGTFDPADERIKYAQQDRDEGIIAQYARQFQEALERHCAV